MIYIFIAVFCFMLVFLGLTWYAGRRLDLEEKFYAILISLVAFTLCFVIVLTVASNTAGYDKSVTFTNDEIASVSETSVTLADGKTYQTKNFKMQESATSYTFTYREYDQTHGLWFLCFNSDEPKVKVQINYK